ncbi:MAG: hypothetical protein ABSB88_26910 [Bryobacteraceae bacterium]|jgi:hypothetical protein
MTTIIFVASTFVVLLASIAIVTPKAVRAAVATLVQVANTTANPAIVSDMNDPGRIPYQSQGVYSSSPSECNSYGCTLNFGPVPANHRLVVQHLSAEVNFNITPAPGQVSLEYVGTGIAGGLSNAPAAFNSPMAGGQFREAFELPVQFYVDQGQSFQVTILASNTLGFLGGTVTASGYMLDCSAAPCSSIAH